jgi:hypothetical protein
MVRNAARADSHAAAGTAMAAAVYWSSLYVADRHAICHPFGREP